MIRVACVSDVHSPKYLELFSMALRKVDGNTIDLFLLGGDMIYKGNVKELGKLMELLTENSIKFPVYACFGNEEYDNLYPALREIGRDKIIFLEDEFISVERRDKTIGIVGTKGSLAEPTWWQAKNIPNIRTQFKNRVKTVEKLIGQMDNCDIRILLSHYATTYKTVIGEPERAFQQMGTPAFEKIVTNPKYKIDIVFHGHAHKGRKFALLNNNVPVYNVAIPLKREITVVNLPRPPVRSSILSYLK